MANDLTSRRWSAQLALVAGLATSEVAVAAAVGIAGVRLALLAAVAVVFVLGYLLTPAPGRCHYEARDRHPVLAMMAALVAAIALTGGLASPLMPLLPAPMLVGWTMFASARATLVLVGFVPLVLGGLAVMPAAWTDVAYDRTDFATLAAWTTALSAWLIGRRIGRLFESLRATWGRLDLVRNGVLSDAESRRRGIESMSTKLAHELKNPLSAIKSLAQLELRSVTEARTRRRLEVMFAETERMQEIIGDYLSFVRPIDEARIGELELGGLMAEVAALLAGRAEAAGIELTSSGEAGTVVADARLLKEAIVNLASNALQATPRGGTVALSYEVGARGAHIVVRDTGSGMTPEVKARVGTPFFTTREEGTGLGVAIARSAIAQHHGTLELASAPGRGTVATIALPRACAA